jgi:hypothetical protein
MRGARPERAYVALAMRRSISFIASPICSRRTGVRRAFQLPRQLRARQAKRFHRPVLFRIDYRRRAALPLFVLAGIQLFLKPRLRINKSFTCITHDQRSPSSNSPGRTRPRLSHTTHGRVVVTR